MMAVLFVSKANGQFQSGSIYLGAHTGLIGLGSAIPLGFDGEIGLGKVGCGIIGIGGIVDYYSYHGYDDYFGYTDMRYVDFLLPVLYHFESDDEQSDPFLGFFLGYKAADYHGNFGNLSNSSPTLGLIGGFRYFFNDNWAAEARLGGGFRFYLLALGIDYGIVPKADAQFDNQKNYCGVHLGLGSHGDPPPLTLGINYERGITRAGEAGPGIIGVGALFDYYSGNSPDYGEGKRTYVNFGVSGMYHFVLATKQWDPFLGVIFGYEHASKWHLSEWSSDTQASGFVLCPILGFRYFFAENWGIQFRVSYGFYDLASGIDYRF